MWVRNDLINFDNNTDKLSELVNAVGSVISDKSASTWKNLAVFIGKEESESLKTEFKDAQSYADLGKKVIAIIPARGGSTRIPRKNIKLIEEIKRSFQN